MHCPLLLLGMLLQVAAQWQESLGAVLLRRRRSLFDAARIAGARTISSPSLRPAESPPPPLEQEQEDAARHIRRVISESCNGVVDDIVHSLRLDPSCSAIRLTPRLLDDLLPKFGDDWKSALGLFRWAASRPGYEHTSYGYDKMVDILGKMKHMDLMWGLLREMREGGVVTLETVAKVMRRLAGGRRWKDAVKLFDELESMGIDRDTESMNILLDTLCKEKKVEVAREVFLELKAYIPPSAHTFNIFVHGWCNARKLDEAMWTIQEMKSYGFLPSVITYSTVIQAHCKRCNFSRAFALLGEMEAEGCAPNVVTYTIMLHSMSKLGDVDEIVSLVQRMKTSGCKPDTLFYNSLINVLGRAGRLSEAFQIFDVEMPMSGVVRNVSTYNTMITAFCEQNQEQNALDVLKELESSSCTPDLGTYRPLLKLCLKSVMLDDRLRSLLDDIVNKHHLSLDLDTYTLLIHGLCREGRVEWACLLFDEMIAREILPRYRTCQLLMYAAEQKGMHGAIERIRSSMKQSNSSVEN